MLKALITVVSLYTLVLNTLSINFQLSRHYPNDPWESGLTVEALRFSHGLTVYENEFTQHATHMYGWANTVLLGTLFRFLPESNQTGRYVSLFFSLSVMVLLTVLLSRGQPWTYWLWSFSSFVAIHQMGGTYAAANRPDWICIFFSLLFVLMYRSHRKTALVALVTAISFKQTAAMWAVLPAVAAVIESRLKPNLFWIKSLLPCVVVGLHLLTLKLLFPVVFHYNFETFGSYPVQLKHVLTIAWTQLAALPLLAALALAVGKNAPLKKDGAYYLSALLISLAACSLAAAKPGGTTNSLIPFFLVATGTSLWGIRELWQARLPQGQGALLILLWLLQTFPHGPSLNRYFLATDKRQADYPAAIAYLASMDKGFIAPEDPTLEYFSKGQFGRNFYLERDAQGPWMKAPSEIESYLTGAPYVVDVVDWWGDWHISPTRLETAGFVPDKDLGSYRIWKKVVRP